MTTIHNLGFPRYGVKRELKFAMERYWRGELDRAALEAEAATLRQRHWRLQAEAGVDRVPVGDFSFYDHVLDTSVALGVIPPRFHGQAISSELDLVFLLARGGKDTPACEMTKWFDTNYHYIVPEFSPDQRFELRSNRLENQFAEAKALGLAPIPVIVGPLTYLWLGKVRGGEFDKLALLDRLIPIYTQWLQHLAASGADWVQIDEPILALDLPPAWQQAFVSAYEQFRQAPVKKLLTVYFGPLENNLDLACALPVDGLHIDAVRAAAEVPRIKAKLADHQVLSLGIVDGRNIWRSELEPILAQLEPLHRQLGERLWLAPSCSLLHVPIDLSLETALDQDLRSWLAFGRQKLQELAVLKTGLDQGRPAVAEALEQSRAAAISRARSPRIHHPEIKRRAQNIGPELSERHSPYVKRASIQRDRLRLPLLPTTTIGSFPQTAVIREARRDFKAHLIDQAEYQIRMREAIAEAVRIQEEIGLDVLVHGEAERNDMVEYFGEQLDGFAFTEHGWVQSYGSRCVKPPIIYGDVSRPAPMTVEWTRYAQSLTDKPMKGMLTGPVTILQWSFVRNDQARSETAMQIALALREEVHDLERAGINIIQIDEPALREGLPLRRAQWKPYLDWAVCAFRVTASGVDNGTQIHTHMCYSEFNDIIEAIANLDADVITIEAARSHMELLEAFRLFEYPNEIGPGVYDIHSPRLPTADEMITLMQEAAQYIPLERLWINPDCGLKTRRWEDVTPALRTMVSVARQLRAGISQTVQ